MPGFVFFQTVAGVEVEPLPALQGSARALLKKAKPRINQNILKLTSG